MLSAVCCWSSIIVLVIRLSDCWNLLDSCRKQDLFDNVECSEVRLVRWWACSGSNRLLLCPLWSVRCFDSEVDHCCFGHSDLSHRSHCQNLVSEGCHASPKTYALMLLGIVSVINPVSIVYRWGDINWLFCRLSGVRLSDVCLSLRYVSQGNIVSVKSDVCFWKFIDVAVRYCLGQQGGWCQMGVSEASFVDEVRCLFLRLHRSMCVCSIRFLFLRWITVDEVRCLCLKLHHWHTFDKVRRLFLKLYHWYWCHSVFCHNCLVPGFTDGAGFLFCDDVVKTENLDWIFLLDVSLLLRLACGRISVVEYVRWIDLFETY